MEDDKTKILEGNEEEKETPEVVETEKTEEEKSEDIRLTNEIRSLKTEIKVLIDLLKTWKKEESVDLDEESEESKGVDLEEIKKGLVI